MAYNGRSSFKLNRALALVEGWTAQTLAGDATLTVKDSQSQGDMAIVYATDDIADAATSGWALFFMVSGAIT